MLHESIRRLLPMAICALWATSVQAYNSIAIGKAAGSYYGSALMIDELMGNMKCKNNEFPKYKTGAANYVYNDIMRNISKADRIEFAQGMKSKAGTDIRQYMGKASRDLFQVYYKKDKTSACYKTELVLFGIHTKGILDFYSALKS